jgi:long-subunit acyl-CoA synthetase (AMP-forming)
LDFIQNAIDKVNAKANSRVHQIKRWAILDRDFSVGGGELTPTLKVKRKLVVKKFNAVIEEIYSQPKL